MACESHGNLQAAFVCQHLFSGSGRGFNWAEDPDDPDARCPDAWCNACEAIWQEEGEWNEHAMAFADIKVVCVLCYESIRERNWVKDPGEEFQIGSYERWDQGTGQLVFSNGGRPRVIADIAFVGSVSTKTNTWLWSWANSSHLETAKATMREVRAYGEKHRLLKLAGAHWSATDQDGWQMTAIAALLLGAVGAYRTPSDYGFTFMVMTRVSWAQ